MNEHCKERTDAKSDEAQTGFSTVKNTIRRIDEAQALAVRQSKRQTRESDDVTQAQVSYETVHGTDKRVE